GINRGAGAAYTNIRIEPQLVHGLNWASASTETIHGTVSSAWRRVGTGYELKVSIPAGTTASVHLPLLKLADPEITESGNAVYISGKPQTGLSGFSSVNTLQGNVVCNIGSGTYVFRVGE